MRFVHESFIEAPPSRVFAFHEEKDALPRLTPPWEKVEVVQLPPSLQPGARAILRLTLFGPLHVTWVAEHTRYEKDVFFEDRQISGPFRSWLHTHRFLPARGGTTLRDEVEYTLPLGPLGLAGLPLVRHKLRRMFEYRHEVTRKACTG